MSNFITAFLLLLYFAASQAYFVSVDANAEECFFDRVTSGSKMSLTFEVSEGGFLDVDVRVYGPDGAEIYKGDRESNGKYAFAAPVDGVYKYCFGNKMSSVTPKVIMFSMEIGEKHTSPENDKDGAEHTDKLETMINELSTTLTSVKHEQEYMEIRERVHRSINDNTNSRVVLWAFFESLVLVAMTLGQVYYLKRFFEVRRAV